MGGSGILVDPIIWAGLACGPLIEMRASNVTAPLPCLGRRNQTKNHETITLVHSPGGGSKRRNSAGNSVPYAAHPRRRIHDGNG